MPPTHKSKLELSERLRVSVHRDGMLGSFAPLFLVNSREEYLYCESLNWLDSKKLQLWFDIHSLLVEGSVI